MRSTSQDADHRTELPSPRRPCSRGHASCKSRCHRMELSHATVAPVRRPSTGQHPWSPPSPQSARRVTSQMRLAETPEPGVPEDESGVAATMGGGSVGPGWVDPGRRAPRSNMAHAASCERGRRECHDLPSYCGRRARRARNSVVTGKRRSSHLPSAERWRLPTGLRDALGVRPASCVWCQAER